MDKTEIELLRSNHFNLCRITNCSEELLSFFYEHHILSMMDIETITSKIEGFQRASEFYRIIQTKTNAFAVLIEGLRKTRQTGAIKLLTGADDVRILIDDLEFLSELSPSPGPSSRTGISFEVFPPVHSFKGRTKEVEDLHKLIMRGRQAETVSLASQLTCLVGLGGIGKTQLARYYVQRNVRDFDGNVIWLNAETENGLTDCFKRFASNLFLEKKIKSIKLLVEKVFKYFEGSKALFVFDNAEKVPWLKNFFPEIFKNSNLHFLITSREQEWDRGVEVMQLDGLSQNDAVLLVKSGLKIKAPDKNLTEDINELVSLLQFYPLALQQAIAYIYEQQITSSFTVQDYLHELKIKEQEMLSFQDKSLYEETFTATTATIWRLTLDKIKADPEHGHLASLILNVVAYLYPDYIWRDLFYRLESLNLVFDNCIFHFERINAAVRLLVKYSILTGRENQTVLSVHRLVQAVTRNQIVQYGIEEHVLKVAILILSESKETFSTENIPHALIVWRHAWKHNQLIQLYSWQVCNIFCEMTNSAHEEGEGFGQEALTRLDEVLGAGHRYCLYVQNFIAQILTKNEKYKKAVAILNNILPKADSLHVKDNLLCLLIKANLAVAILYSGKLEQAVDIAKQLFENCKYQFGENERTALLAEANFGLALLDLGYLEEALAVFQKLIKNTSGNMLDVLRFRFDVARIYLKKGYNKKALKIVREIYQTLKPVDVEQVNDFAELSYNLAKMLIVLGKYTEALEVLEKNLDTLKGRVTSEVKLRTFEFQILIGANYEGLGNNQKALELYECAMASMIVTLGKNSPRVKILSEYIDAFKKNTRKGLSLLVCRLKCYVFMSALLICFVVLLPLVFM